MNSFSLSISLALALVSRRKKLKDHFQINYTKKQKKDERERSNIKKGREKKYFFHSRSIKESSFFILSRISELRVEKTFFFVSFLSRICSSQRMSFFFEKKSLSLNFLYVIYQKKMFFFHYGDKVCFLKIGWHYTHSVYISWINFFRFVRSFERKCDRRSVNIRLYIHVALF